VVVVLERKLFGVDTPIFLDSKSWMLGELRGVGWWSLVEEISFKIEKCLGYEVTFRPLFCDMSGYRKEHLAT
jgi:hypothetical protein